VAAAMGLEAAAAARVAMDWCANRGKVPGAGRGEEAGSRGDLGVGGLADRGSLISGRSGQAFRRG